MSKTINVQITIDTDLVRSKYPKPSQDSKKPTGIDHQEGFMISTGSSATSGQGTGDLTFKANVGDTVRFFGTSGSNNFEDSILVYNFPRYSGDQVFGTFDSKLFEKSGIAPSTGASVLPGKIGPMQFWFDQTDVVRAGTEGYKVQFALYIRNVDTGQPQLFGYYSWDPTITVKG